MKRQWPAPTEVLTTGTAARFRLAVRRAVRYLRAGELVGLPTETVYGLAANALDARAVTRIFEIKGRPAHNPIIVHVASMAMAKRCVRTWPARAQRLAAAFWPGPLTMVLPRAAIISDVVTAGGPTVGVRWPSHPFIQAVIRACGFPLAAPSANLSARLSPTTAEHVRASLNHRIPLVIDGGPAGVGIESTVVDLTNPTPRLLRPGMIRPEALAAIIGPLEIVPAKTPPATGEGTKPRSPGLLRRHYAPQARLVIWRWADSADLEARVAKRKVPLARVHIIAHTRVPRSPAFGRVCVLPREPAAFARNLYAELHRCDATGACLIVTEVLPATPRWRALRDRLERAAAAG